MALMGYTGKPAEEHIHDNAIIAHFAVAVAEHWRDKTSGERRERVTWFRCTAFGKLAELCLKLLKKKGTPVYLEGRMRMTSKPDPDTGRPREYWGVQVDMIKIISPAKPATEYEQQAPDDDFSQEQ
jgi:single-strand DNA-binding protein